MYKNYIIIVKPVECPSLNFKPSRTVSKQRRFMYIERRKFIFKRRTIMLLDVSTPQV